MTLSSQTVDVTLTVPHSLLERVQHIAQVLHRPVEDILLETLQAALPAVDDAPPEMQTELMAMAWLDEPALWEIANSTMTDVEQRELQTLNRKQATKTLSPSEQKTLEALRQRYGEVTLRKAHAYALLSLRGGKPLLANIADSE